VTLICVWRDQSFNVDRLIALGDMRISSKSPEAERTSRTVISDLSRKLVPITVACHNSNALSPVTGAMTEPYTRMEIGVAFSGRVLEAQTIIHHMQHYLSNLVAPEGGQPQVEPAALGEWTRRLGERYFASHNDRNKATVTLVLFGWSGEVPWFQRVRWNKTSAELETGVFDSDTFLSAGEDASFVKSTVKGIRDAVKRHKRKVPKSFDGEDGAFEADKMRSQLDNAARRTAEQSVIDKIISEANDSIGGTLQKMELARGQRAACTRLSEEYALEQDMSLSMTDPLFPFDYTENMGRRRGEVR